MKMTIFAVLALLPAAISFSSLPQAMASMATTDISKQSVATQCTTRSTGGDGVRHGCTSEWVNMSAPAGYVINEQMSKVRRTSGRGSEKVCQQFFEGHVEVIPGTGLTAPTTTRIRAKARGPKGRWKGRGWAHCEALVHFTKYR